LRVPPIGVLWPIMAVLVALYAAHQGLGLGGRGVDGFFDDWINDGLLWCAAVACLVGALRASRSRVAWLLVALALASWAVGDTIWSIRFGHAAAPPSTSISDVFWLAWYPLIVAALALLVRDRVPGFELHRWIDGVAVMLLVATPWVALFLQPVAEHSSASGLAVVLDFAYPLGDAVLVGAILGVFAVMAWRPGRMWLALGVALTVMGVADAVNSVQALGHSHDRGVYDAAWAGAAILVAYAAWRPHPGRLERREVTGWSAIALALAAQALAVSIQTYAIFDEIPRSERILTVIVLVIATIQIVVSRPRPRSDSRAQRDAPGLPASMTTSDRRDTSGANTAAPKAN
jgi:diguanylate cyclase